MNTDQLYMTRAIELARNGLGQVAPNPMVGCVIVHHEKIIGEGWHRRYGGPHAEVNAINSVDNQELLPKSIVYVNLEPCAHFGKTPPCADLLVEKRVKKVVIANTDPNPKVDGSGIAKLKAAGIEVVVGVCEKEATELNRRFFTAQKKKRPYVILKWAQTSDGFIARSNYDSKWISNEASRTLVHKWRSEEPAILVGYQTALHDDPQLNVRNWSGENPLRLVIDPKLQLPDTLKLFDGSQPTVVYHRGNAEKTTKYERVGQTDIKEILADLQQRDIQSLIVEGGSATLQKFIDLDLWDAARVFVGDQTFGEGIAAPRLNKNIFAKEMIKGDQLLIYKNY